jgi:8-oxo-dGTP pyrophosphatase MutT (NUDIX family)
MQIDPTYTIQDVKQALSIADFDAYSAQSKMIPAARQSRRDPDKPGRARLGCVLILLYPVDGELQLVLTRRRDDLNSHAGQMSFPGGKREGQESLVMTALRETEEEIGLSVASVEVIGELTPLYIPPSDFKVHPFVAYYDNGNRPSFTPNPDEVAEIFEVPLRQLLDPSSRGEQLWDFRGQSITVPYYAVGQHKVWGATAMMISEFAERLQAVRSHAGRL